MTIRRSFRIVAWAAFALAGYFLVLVIYVARQNRLEQRAYENERTAGLAATPPEVRFDLRSMWGQRGIISGIAGLISPAGQRGGGGLLPTPSIPPPIKEKGRVRLHKKGREAGGGRGEKSGG